MLLSLIDPTPIPMPSFSSIPQSTMKHIARHTDRQTCGGLQYLSSRYIGIGIKFDIK